MTDINCLAQATCWNLYMPIINLFQEYDTNNGRQQNVQNQGRTKSAMETVRCRIECKRQNYNKNKKSDHRQTEFGLYIKYAYFPYQNDTNKRPL